MKPSDKLSKRIEAMVSIAGLSTDPFSFMLFFFFFLSISIVVHCQTGILLHFLEIVQLNCSDISKCD